MRYRATLEARVKQKSGSPHPGSELCLKSHSPSIAGSTQGCQTAPADEAQSTSSLDQSMFRTRVAACRTAQHRHAWLRLTALSVPMSVQSRTDRQDSYPQSAWPG